VRRGRELADAPGRGDSGAVLLFVVPGLLLVVLGYAVGYAVLEELIAVTGADLPASAPEVGGWITGVVLAIAVSAGVVVRVRRLRRPAGRGGRDGGHQK
jgi:hypothetical protein